MSTATTPQQDRIEAAVRRASALAIRQVRRERLIAILRSERAAMLKPQPAGEGQR